MGTVAENRSASKFVGTVGTVPNEYYNSMYCTVTETETANAWGSVQWGRPMQHEERMTVPRAVDWESPVRYGDAVNGAGPAYWERPEYYEQPVKNEALRGEREDEQPVKKEPPRGERDCVEQLEGVPYFEPSVSGDQTKERSGDPTQTAVAVKNEDVGVPENAVKNDDSNGLAELGDPNNLSDTTEPTPNLEMLPENADSGSVLGTLNEDATFAQRERVVAAMTNSVDPVAHAELEDTTEKPEEDTTKEDDAGSPPPHARLCTLNELHAPGSDALSVGANEKSVCENALVLSSIPRICMVQTEDSDERDVGGGGHVDERPDPHVGGFVPVGESLASNRLRGVTLECVEQDVGARAHAVQVYGGVAVEVGELHGIYGVRLVPAANGYAKGAVDYRITLSVDELRMDEERSARERKITSWTGVLPVLLVLGTLTLGAQVLVRWLLNESRDDGWWTSLL
ncbi:hypothetical protein PF002_g7713 [Phytophthora fragariae]|uniref:Uncharacterized protein n=1 Tax=Phytophthora fragariae TaxID=53985 RepID=A0A6A3ZZB1_9STRA|nr:hypothetical protein PF002_g7713 [Phytophthora fragariae]